MTGAAYIEHGKSNALALRSAIYGNGDPTRADLEDLIACGRQAGSDPAFCVLIAEVATDVFVHQVDPEGYVSDADAGWLVARLSGGGGLSCAAEFEMLKGIFSHAVSVPLQLTKFAISEVKSAILTGRRDAVGGVDHEPGVVTHDDVLTLRAMAFAPTQGSSLHVDRGTAEALFEIAHATATASNDPEFADFFARAVGNYLIGVAFLGTPDRADVLAHEAELDVKPTLAGFLAAMVGVPSKEDLANALESTEGVEEDAYLNQNLETEARETDAERIGADKCDWVLAHLTRDGSLTEAEKRLLTFLKEEAASTTPELTALFAKAA